MKTLVMLSVLFMLACAGTGGERQACYPNGTCNAGLVCLSNLCVAPSGDGGGDVVSQVDARADASTDVGNDVAVDSPLDTAMSGPRLTVVWTINGGANCPTDPAMGGAPGGTIAGMLNRIGGGAPLNLPPTPCTASRTTIDLAQTGNYELTLQLTDPGHPGVVPSAMTPAPVSVSTSGDTIMLDIACPCCPNPPGGATCP